MKRPFLLSIIIIISLVAATGTFAYFTDQVQTDAIVASGNISILQHEYERVKDANGAYTGQYQPCSKQQLLYPGSDIDKIVQIENNGKNSAYVRTFVAVPAYYAADGSTTNWINLNRNEAATEWLWCDEPISNVQINGAAYDVFYATYTKQLLPGETTEPCILGYHVSEQVDHNGKSYTFTMTDGTVVPLTAANGLMILVSTEASQTTVFDTAEEALNVFFGGEPDVDRNPW